MTVPDATPVLDIWKERAKRYADAYQMQHEGITRLMIRVDAIEKKIRGMPAMEKRLQSCCAEIEKLRKRIKRLERLERVEPDESVEEESK
jgi:hypothetical protein